MGKFVVMCNRLGLWCSLCCVLGWYERVLSDCRRKAMVQCRGQREGRLQVERYLPSSKIDLIKFRQ